MLKQYCVLSSVKHGGTVLKRHVYSTSVKCARMETESEHPYENVTILSIYPEQDENKFKDSKDLFDIRTSR